MLRARTALLLLLGSAASSCVSLDSFFFSPRRIPAGEDYTLGYSSGWPASMQVPAAQQQRFTVTDSDGRTVYAVLVTRENAAATAAAPTVIYHHGNSYNIDYLPNGGHSYWERASLLWSLGANVVIYDYCGYGRTEGTTAEACIYSAARAVTDFVRAQGPRFDQSRIYHYGYSMGTAAASEMTANYGGARGLVLEAPFTSAAGLMADGSLVVPRSFLMSNRFDNKGRIRRAAASSSQGVLIVHGDIDDFVQTKYGAELAAEITRDTPAGTSNFVRVPGANHGDVPFVADSQFSGMYSNLLRNFLFAPPPAIR